MEVGQPYPGSRCGKLRVSAIFYRKEAESPWKSVGEGTRTTDFGALIEMLLRAFEEQGVMEPR
jgi:hypothetical protein